jgi:hypothetical protein
MALVLAINDIIRAQYVCSDSDQASFNTVHYKVTGVGGTPATLDDFAATWEAAIHALVKPLICNVSSFDGVIAQVISPLPLMARVFSTIHQGVGTGGAVGQGRQVAGLIRFRTDFAGPGFRGRNYLPFPSTSASQLYGTPTAAYNTAALALADAIFNFAAFAVGGRTATVDMGLFKRAGSIFTPVTNVSASPDWATQKRRGTFGRPNLPPI